MPPASSEWGTRDDLLPLSCTLSDGVSGREGGVHSNV
jgi:hypothetical protein